MSFPSVVLSGLGFHVCGPEWSLTPERSRNWNDLDFWFIVKGKGSIRSSEGEFPLVPGAFILMRGGEDYTATMNPKAPFHHYYCHFCYTGFEGPFGYKRMNALPNFHRVLRQWRLLSELLEKALSCYRAGGTMRTKANDWLGAVMAEVESCDVQGSLRGGEDLSLYESVAAQAKRISEYPEKNYSITRLASELNISRGHYWKLFSAHLGLSPKAYLMNARMDKAKYLIKNTDLSMTEISKSLGHGNPFLFSKQFRTYFRMSPTQYRNGNQL